MKVLSASETKLLIEDHASKIKEASWGEGVSCNKDAALKIASHLERLRELSSHLYALSDEEKPA